MNTIQFYLTQMLTTTTIFNDVPEPLQIGFQDGASPGYTGIVALHDSIFFYLVLIAVGVMWMLFSVMINYSAKKSPITHKYANHGTLIELIWTITPAFILIAIAFPSFKLLYMLDEVISPALTIKVSGNQWFWSYEYSDFIREEGDPIEFDSYMIPESDLEMGQFRNLDVDNRVVVPVDTHVRFIVTGRDVIHNFAVPSLGLKIDRGTRKIKSNFCYPKKNRIILWTMFWNLWRVSWFHAYRYWRCWSRKLLSVIRSSIIN